MRPRRVCAAAQPKSPSVARPAAHPSMATMHQRPLAGFPFSTKSCHFECFQRPLRFNACVAPQPFRRRRIFYAGDGAAACAAGDGAAAVISAESNGSSSASKKTSGSASEVDVAAAAAHLLAMGAAPYDLLRRSRRRSMRRRAATSSAMAQFMSNFSGVVAGTPHAVVSGGGPTKFLLFGDQPCCWLWGKAGTRL